MLSVDRVPPSPPSVTRRSTSPNCSSRTVSRRWLIRSVPCRDSLPCGRWCDGLHRFHRGNVHKPLRRCQHCAGKSREVACTGWRTQKALPGSGTTDWGLTLPDQRALENGFPQVVEGLPELHMLRLPQD